MEEQQILLGVVRQHYASVVWTHKIQEKQAELYARQFKILETVNIIVTALTSCGIIVSILSYNIASQIVAAVLSFFSLAITAYLKSFDLKSLEVSNKNAANNFLVIRHELLNVIATIKLSKEDIEKTKSRYEDIIERLDKLYINAPATTKKACNLAEKALKEMRDYSFTEEEIDMFLPQSLKMGSN